MGEINVNDKTRNGNAINVTNLCSISIKIIKTLRASENTYTRCVWHLTYVWGVWEWVHEPYGIHWLESLTTYNNIKRSHHSTEICVIRTFWLIKKIRRQFMYILILLSTLWIVIISRNRNFNKWCLPFALSKHGKSYQSLTQSLVQLLWFLHLLIRLWATTNSVTELQCSNFHFTVHNFN